MRALSHGRGPEDRTLGGDTNKLGWAQLSTAIYGCSSLPMNTLFVSNLVLLDSHNGSREIVNVEVSNRFT